MTRARKTCTVAGCESPHRARGFCNAHYISFRKSGGPRLDSHPSPARDFLETVVVSFDGPDCLFWPFARTPLGYGVIKKGNGGTGIVSRLVCERAHGLATSPDLVAAHSCGNGHLGCVNPRHIRWATHTENMRDMADHGRRPVGESAHNSKLTDDEVREIHFQRGRQSQRLIGERFGVSQSHISHIHSGRLWSHLHPAKSLGGDDA